MRTKRFTHQFGTLLLSYLLIFLIASDVRADVAIGKGTNLQYVGYIDFDHLGDAGFEFFTVVIEDEPNLVLEQEAFGQFGRSISPIKRFISSDALQSSRIYDPTFADVGQNNSNDKTGFQISKEVFDEVKSGKSSDLIIRHYLITPKGKKEGWETVGSINLVKNTTATVSVDGILSEVPALKAQYVGLHREILNGYDYQDYFVMDLVILDDPSAVILRETHNYYKNIDDSSQSLGTWNSSLIRLFSIEGLKSNLEKGLLKSDAVVLDGIRFAFDSDKIEKSSMPFLNAISEVLSSNPEWDVTLLGYTDFLGDPTHNLDL